MSMIYLIVLTIVSWVCQKLFLSLYRPGFYASIIWLLVGLILISSGLSFYKDIWHAHHYFKETLCKVITRQTIQVPVEGPCLNGGNDNAGHIYHSQIGACPSISCTQYQVNYTAAGQYYTAFGKEVSTYPFCISETYNERGTPGEFIIDQNYFCWYDPENLGNIYLDRGQASISPVVIGIRIFIIVLIALQNFFLLSNTKNTTTASNPRKVEYITLEDGRTIRADYSEKIRNEAATILTMPMISAINLMLSTGMLLSFLLFISDLSNAVQFFKIDRDYIPSVCKVLDKKTKEDNIIRVSYFVKNISYATWTHDIYDTTNQGDNLNQYVIGEDYACKYNSDQPRIVFLTRSHSYPFSNLLIEIGIFIICITGKKVLSKKGNAE